MSAPVCPTCGTAARLTDGRQIYPHRPDLADKPIWACAVCGDSYVGCHPGTAEPLGVPADAALREARQLLHRRMIDPLWQTADRCGEYEPENDEAREVIRRAARGRVYGFMAERMGLTREQAHTAMFDLEQCRAAWRALQGVTYPQIRAWAQKRPPSEAKVKKERKAAKKAKSSKALAAPTDEERGAAAIAAVTLRAALADLTTWGEQSTMHADLARPRRGVWITTWANLPGFSRVNDAYQHALLPGWQYTAPELAAEMVPDLEALAEHGVRPTEATSKEAAAA